MGLPVSMMLIAVFASLFYSRPAQAASQFLASAFETSSATSSKPLDSNSIHCLHVCYPWRTLGPSLNFQYNFGLLGWSIINNDLEMPIPKPPSGYLQPAASPVREPARIACSVRRMKVTHPLHNPSQEVDSTGLSDESSNNPYFINHC